RAVRHAPAVRTRDEGFRPDARLLHSHPIPRPLRRELPAGRRVHVGGRPHRRVEVAAHRLHFHRRDVPDLRDRVQRDHAEGAAGSGLRVLDVEIGMQPCRTFTSPHRGEVARAQARAGEGGQAYRESSAPSPQPSPGALRAPGGEGAGRACGSVCNPFQRTQRSRSQIMEAFELLFLGFQVLLTPKTIGLMMVGLVLGIFVGVLPGLGGPNGVAILLPLTFTMDPTSAIVMLACIYWGALFGGAITSILFNIPGEAWSVATTFDGYPMAQQGRAAEALTAAFTSSFIGSLSAVLLITFLAPRIADFALRFGPPEFFAVYFLTFCSFVGLGKEERHKIVISMALGLLLAGVGMDTVSGQLRMTFGWSELLRGISFLVAVIGLFGISEILLTMEERLALRGHVAHISLRVVLQTWASLPRYWATLLRSSAIGCWLGV